MDEAKPTVVPRWLEKARNELSYDLGEP